MYRPVIISIGEGVWNFMLYFSYEAEARCDESMRFDEDLNITLSSS